MNNDHQFRNSQLIIIRLLRFEINRELTSQKLIEKRDLLYNKIFFLPKKTIVNSFLEL